MSAFCGIFNLDQRPVLQDEIAKISSQMVLWTPDKKFQWQDNNLAVSQWQRYHTPEAKFATFPTRNGQNHYLLASNTRLDNRDELAQKLNIPAVEAKAMADENFLLLAYQKWQDDCPAYLLGDFAFVIWDANKKQLFLAQDQVGNCKAIYYCHQPGKRFVFASNIRPVYEHPQIPIELNEHMVAVYLAHFIGDRTETFYKNIYRVPNGHRVIVKEKGLKVEKYPAREHKKVRYKKDEEYIEHFKELFFAAVKCRMRSDTPMATQLSGGLDSSAVTAVAATLLQGQNKKIYAFGAVPPKGVDLSPYDKYLERYSPDESVYMEAVASLYSNVDLTKVMGQTSSIFSSIDQYQSYAEIPVTAAYNRMWFEEILDNCQKRNLRNCLAGNAGNRTISRFVPRPSHLAFIKYTLKRNIKMHKNWLAYLFNRLSYRGSGIINPDFAKQYDLFTATNHIPFVKTYKFSSKELLDIINMNCIFAPYEAIYGVESRDPSGDLRILQLLDDVPIRIWYSKDQNRMLVRNGLSELLPDIVKNRCNYGAQAPEWYARFEKERSDFMRLVSEMVGSAFAKKYFVISRLEGLLFAWSWDNIYNDVLKANVDYGVKFAKCLLAYTFIRDMFFGVTNNG